VINSVVLFECAGVAGLVSLVAAGIQELIWSYRLRARPSASAWNELRGRLECAEQDLERLRQRVGDAEQRFAPPSDLSAFPASLHLTRRGQVTQLRRRGETVQGIASALGMSQGEVRLIIKLQDLSRTLSDKGRSKF